MARKRGQFLETWKRNRAKKARYVHHNIMFFSYLMSFFAHFSECFMGNIDETFALGWSKQFLKEESSHDKKLMFTLYNLKVPKYTGCYDPNQTNSVHQFVFSFTGMQLKVSYSTNVWAWGTQRIQMPRATSARCEEVTSKVLHECDIRNKE